MQNQAGAAESELYFKRVPKIYGCLQAPVEGPVTVISGNVTSKGASYLFKIEEPMKGINGRDWRE